MISNVVDRVNGPTAVTFDGRGVRLVGLVLLEVL